MPFAIHGETCSTFSPERARPDRGVQRARPAFELGHHRGRLRGELDLDEPSGRPNRRLSMITSIA